MWEDHVASKTKQQEMLLIHGVSLKPSGNQVIRRCPRLCWQLANDPWEYYHNSLTKSNRFPSYTACRNQKTHVILVMETCTSWDFFRVNCFFLDFFKQTKDTSLACMILMVLFFIKAEKKKHRKTSRCKASMDLEVRSYPLFGIVAATCNWKTYGTPLTDPIHFDQLQPHHGWCFQTNFGHLFFPQPPWKARSISPCLARHMRKLAGPPSLEMASCSAVIWTAAPQLPGNGRMAVTCCDWCPISWLAKQETSYMKYVYHRFKIKGYYMLLQYWLLWVEWIFALVHFCTGYHFQGGRLGHCWYPIGSHLDHHARESWKTHA